MMSIIKLIMVTIIIAFISFMSGVASAVPCDNQSRTTHTDAKVKKAKKRVDEIMKEIKTGVELKSVEEQWQEALERKL